MAMTYTQESRPIAVTTPLGADALLLEKFEGHEALSQPFHFRLDLLALKTTKVPFDKLLGQQAAIRLDLPDKKKRYFHGIISRVTQGRTLRGVEAEVAFVRYRMEIVPQFWMFTHRTQSRIFQQLSIPDILKKVLEGLDVSYQIQGSFHPRDYCVQYRETDYHFASRLMEEEGIYYYFKHTEKGHQMVVANTPQSHADVPGNTTVQYEEILRRSRLDERIIGWEKSQELRAGKVSLRDHSFEKPDDNFEAIRPVQDSVQVGTVAHKLKVGGNDKMELYDFPGGYAGRFDGVDPGGGLRAADLQKISQDNARTAGIRMAQETLATLLITATSDCRQLASGCKFTLENHSNANGAYVLTRVEHSASIEGTYTSGEESSLRYENRMQCIPFTLPYAPPRITPKARVAGTQTAVVVGPAGKEIHTDQYGRVRVKFFWDRDAKKDGMASCWVRVGTHWAGQQWGAIHIPRIGQEVIVDFLEGDPDQPIIVGSVYNASNMPPYKLPDNQTQSGLKSRSTLKGTAENFNELRFEDKKDAEEIYFHAEKDFNRVVENNDTLKVGFEKKDKGDQTIEVFNNQTVTIGAGKGNAADGSQKVTVYKDRTTKIETGNETLTVEKGKRLVQVDIGDDTHLVKTGNHLVEIAKGNDDHLIKMGNRTVSIDLGNDALTIKTGNQTTKINLGKSATEAMQSIELKVGANSVKIDQSGVTIQGLVIKLQGQVQVQVQAPIVQIAGTGLTEIKGGVVLIN